MLQNKPNQLTQRDGLVWPRKSSQRLQTLRVSAHDYKSRS